jgi:hypothetical protein
MTGIERYSTKTKTSYEIGDFGPAGGIIFLTPESLDNATGKYFEVALPGWNVGEDPVRTWAQSSPVNYSTTSVTGADGGNIGNGYQNTIDIINQGNSNTSSSAAALARSYTGGGRNDWFLPSSGEFYALCGFIALNARLGLNGDRYWTSTEYSSSQAIASIPYLDLFGDISVWDKDSEWSVRPVRMFSVEPSASVQRIGNDSIYGGGQDGDVVISSNTSLTRDMYYNNLRIDYGCHLNTNGFKVFVKTALNIEGSIGINSGVSVNTGTVAGTTPLATSTTNSIGGSAAGVTYTASQVSSGVRSYVENILNGGHVSASGNFNAFTGGAGGETGAAGTVTPGANGSGATSGGPGGAGTLNRNALAPGGPGSAGTPGTNGVAGSTPPAAAGGLGARGGGVVVIVARLIAGLQDGMGGGVIVSRGSNASTGGSSATGTGATNGAAGSPGSAAPSQAIAYTTDNIAHYRTGDGVHGAHASIPAPALPTTPVSAIQSNHAFGYWTSTHHGGSCLYGANHHTGHSPAYGHATTTHYPRASASDYFHQNGLNHTIGGPFGHSGGTAYNHAHTSGAIFEVYYHEHDNCPDHVDFKGNHVDGGHQARGRQDQQGVHSNDDYRYAGSARHTGHFTAPGGAAGSAGSAGSPGTNGSTTAGANGRSGGGGGILIVTETQPIGVTTSVSGGTLSGVSGSDGTVLTILNA